MLKSIKLSKKQANIAKITVKIVVSFALIAFLLTSTNIDALKEVLTNTNISLLFLCIVVYLCGQAISAVKWGFISRALGFNSKFTEFVQFYLIGMFFNLFLPSTVGGDAGKAYYIYKNEKKARKAPAIYSVLAERFSGLTVLIAIGAIAISFPFAKDFNVYHKILMIAFWGITGATLIGAPTFRHFLKLVFKENHWANHSLSKDISVFWDAKLVLITLGLSLLFHSLVVGIHVLIGAALNLEIPFYYYLCIYPAVAIAGFIPIGFNGIGWRDMAYVFLFGAIGISQPQAMAFSLLWLFTVTCCSLIGGLVYILGHFSKPEEDDVTPETIAETEKNIYNETSIPGRTSFATNEVN